MTLLADCTTIHTSIDLEVLESLYVSAGQPKGFCDKSRNRATSVRAELLIQSMESLNGGDRNILLNDQGI